MNITEVEKIMDNVFALPHETTRQASMEAHPSNINNFKVTNQDFLAILRQEGFYLTEISTTSNTNYPGYGIDEPIDPEYSDWC